jgi:hypothetical protein
MKNADPAIQNATRVSGELANLQSNTVLFHISEPMLRTEVGAGGLLDELEIQSDPNAIHQHDALVD